MAPVLAQPPQLDDRAKIEIVGKAASLLVEGYVFPDRGEAAASKLKSALAAGAYAKVQTATDMAALLTRDLQSATHDRHLRVTFGEGPKNPDAPADKTSRGGVTHVYLLKGNVGYMRITGFPPPALFAEFADQAMRDLAGTDALIIDLRDNGGGNPSTVAYFCSFFFDPIKPVHINDLVDRKKATKNFSRREFWTRPVSSPYLRKPVYILTRKYTFSGAEEFAYDLQTQGRATIIGETTGGGANPGDASPLGHGFRIFIPAGRAENPLTKTNWEGVGVKPDLKVAASHAFQIAMQRQTGQADDLKNLIAADYVKQWQTRPKGEAVLRTYLDAVARGKPDYKMLSPVQAEETKKSLSKQRRRLAPLGKVQKIEFKQAAEFGEGFYHVTFSGGAMDCALLMTLDGKIAFVYLL